ncbi:MAG: shikimate dehydrogenase [Acidobacteriaceae bacterium]|nr:shikimate dehydrogenase [Acidobacteriaceae bacterium]
MPALPRSLPRICVALGLPTASQLARAAEREYKDGSTFLEFRIDHLNDPAAAPDLVRTLRKRYPDLQILVTCRHKQNQGHFSGTATQQITHLENAALAGAAAIDLEIEAAERARPAVAALRQQAPLLISYHNFESTPALDAVFHRLRRVPADAYKIATTARKPGDNLRILEFVRHHSPVDRLIVFAMSEVGIATRVLTPGLGSLFTYAAPVQGDGTAPGQIAAHELRSLYRCEKLNRQTRVYGVIADPVAHSKSPLIHNRAFQARRVDAVYLPFLIAPGHLSDWMKFAATLPVSGFSVTIPHKQRIVRYLDTVDPLAKRIGAVNTVWRNAGRWRGANTDADGVLKPLSRCIRPAHADILIAGYGGSARAAAIALHDAGARITITGRNLTRAQQLARVVNAAAISLKESQTRRFDVLVHATPVGMYPKSEECLFPDVIPARVVFDMVYNPVHTALLQRAQQQGSTIIHGIDMLLEQAARQFEIWTRESAPRSVMQNALESHAA